jgi:hypothetical protein
VTAGILTCDFSAPPIRHFALVRDPPVAEREIRLLFGSQFHTAGP